MIVPKEGNGGQGLPVQSERVARDDAGLEPKPLRCRISGNGCAQNAKGTRESPISWKDPAPHGSPRAKASRHRLDFGPVVCPYCDANDDKVIDSRASEGGKVIRRRRQCVKCRKRFTTYERVEELARITVIKRDGTRVPFSRDNVLRGVQAACGKRPVPNEVREQLVDEVEEEVYKLFDREVPSVQIGQLVCDKLRNVDDVAYIRFASEHRRFSDLGQIEREVSEMRAHVKDVKEQARLF
ncbi:hypothetical protein BH11PLA1_BH11PLA1_21670 [soil metagenome]